MTPGRFGVVEPRQESTPTTPPGPLPPLSQQPVKARMTRGEVVEAPIAPLDVTGLRTVGVGTTAFAGATLYLLVFQLGWMRETDRLWWLWTCFAGLGLGVFGFVYCTRRARRIIDRPAPHPQED